MAWRWELSEEVSVYVINRSRLEAEARDKVRRMVLYMLAWDGRQVRAPFKYEQRLRGPRNGAAVIRGGFGHGSR